jgi:hypothetical protein
LLRRRQALCTWLLFCWLYCPAHLTPILAAHIDLGQLKRCAPPTSPQDLAAPPVCLPAITEPMGLRV